MIDRLIYSLVVAVVVAVVVVAAVVVVVVVAVAAVAVGALPTTRGRGGGTIRMRRECGLS